MNATHLQCSDTIPDSLVTAIFRLRQDPDEEDDDEDDEDEEADEDDEGDDGDDDNGYSE